MLAAATAGRENTLQQCVMNTPVCVKLVAMTGNPGSYFGKQVKKERITRGWGLDELAKETGISTTLWSRVENGKRPPTEGTAKACDLAFPERKGWFLEYYFELQSWAETPSWFKPFGEHEMSATWLRSWSPNVVDGLLQTEDYTRAQIELFPGISAEQVAERVANRLARQRRVLLRDDPPKAHFLVDITSLQRMPRPFRGGQLRHLLELAVLPHVVIQMVPVCWHAGTSGGFIMTETAAYAEGVHGGQVYGGRDEMVGSLEQRFDSIRIEAMRASESQALIREMLYRERLAKVQLLKRQRR
ncbi:MAG: helix-turn-helix domain-containing protein [Trebonia sp.]